MDLRRETETMRVTDRKTDRVWECLIIGKRGGGGGGGGSRPG